MSTETVTYDQVSVPTCTVTKTTSDTTGRVSYSVSVEILGLSPTRGVTSEERTRGITSLDPPTVEAKDLQELRSLAVEACCTSYHNTEGYTLDATSLTFMSMRAGFGVSQALRLLGEDV